LLQPLTNFDVTLQMDTAMMLHFNVLTPHHDQPSEAGGAHDFPPRPAKRGGLSAPSSDPASTADWCISTVRLNITEKLFHDTHGCCVRQRRHLLHHAQARYLHTRLLFLQL
jgi:hypothetical protein